MPRPLYASELRDGTAEVLVTVEVAGRACYLSQRPLDVPTEAGGSIPFDGGLNAVDVSVVLGLMGSDADLLSVPVACTFPVDIAALRAQGHQLSGATGEVAIWVPGTTYESRQVLVLGQVEEPTYGADREQVAFSISEAPYDDTGTIIAPVEIVHEVDQVAPIEDVVFPSDSEGSPLPWVFGRLGVCTVDGVLSTVPAMPVVPMWVADPALSTAGEVIYAAIGSTAWECSEVVITDSTGASDAFEIDLVQGFLSDALVTTLSGVTYMAVGPLSLALAGVDILATPLYVSASPTTPISGGPSYDGSPTPARSWGEVVEMLLRRSSLRLDWGRWRTVLPLLQRYEVAGYVDDPELSPWEFIASEMLPLVPVSVRSGPDGLYPVLWRYDATAADAVAEIIAGPGTGIIRTGPIAEFPAPQDLVNSCTLSYAYDARTQEYTHWLTHGPPSTLIPPAPASTFVDVVVSPVGATPAQDVTYQREVYAAWTTDLVSSAYSVASVLTHGVMPETLSTRYVYDDATAHLITSWRARSKCFARRKVPYEATTALEWLEIGDVVVLTDAELSITSLPALVLERSLSLTGRVGLVLLVLDDMIGGTNAAP